MADYLKHRGWKTKMPTSDIVLNFRIANITHTSNYSKKKIKQNS